MTDWRDGTLVARADYEAQYMNRIDLLDGHWPAEQTLAVEQRTRVFGNAVGYTLMQAPLEFRCSVA